MASTSTTKLLLLLLFHFMFAAASPVSSIIAELNHPPPRDFAATVATNCHRNPSLKYCNSSAELLDIYKSTIVERHLCVDSNNSNCPEGFTKIDLHGRPIVVPLYLSFSFFWKYCPPTILAIDLSNSSIEGPFPVDLLQCTQIRSLDLRGNALAGDLPVDAFAPLNNLTFLNLSCNRFSESGAAESRWLLGRFGSSSFVRSGILRSEHGHGLEASTTVLLLVVVFVSICSSVGCIGWLFLRRPDYLPSRLRRSHRFTYATLKAATKSFSQDNFLGRDEKEEHYRGIMRDGTQVHIEIKRGRVSAESRRAFDEKCRTLVQLDHKNLMKLLGWCNGREVRAVVAAGPAGAESVERWLLRSPPWKQRLNVMREVLEGMCYLQDQWPQVGYDLRTKNVMLVEDLEPLITKFKVEEHSAEERKVYKFGMFSLELVSSRQKREESETDVKGLAEWTRMHYPKNLRNVVDEKMKLNSTSYDQLKQVIGIGLTCTEPSAEHLPRISQISTMLRKTYTSSSDQLPGTSRRENHEIREQESVQSV